MSDLERDIDELVELALAEDIGSGDVTTEVTVPEGLEAKGTIIQKQPGVVFGYQMAKSVFIKLDPDIGWNELEYEGLWRDRRTDLVEVMGSARALLTGERAALNFLQQLSGVSTLTALFVEKLRGSSIQLIDTRKTVPGMRRLQKAAVVAGGGENHRMGLYDAVLIKNNHADIAGSITKAVELAIEKTPEGIPVKTECRDIDEVNQAVCAGATWLLLDNMTSEQIGEAAELVAGRAELEISGGINLDNIGDYLSLPVQYIAVGALTHSAPALDLSMKIEVI